MSHIASGSMRPLPTWCDVLWSNRRPATVVAPQWDFRGMIRASWSIGVNDFVASRAGWFQCQEVNQFEFGRQFTKDVPLPVDFDWWRYAKCPLRR
jgi:hypothetical protein